MLRRTAKRRAHRARRPRHRQQADSRGFRAQSAASRPSGSSGARRQRARFTSRASRPRARRSPRSCSSSKRRSKRCRSRRSCAGARATAQFVRPVHGVVAAARRARDRRQGARHRGGSARPRPSLPRRARDQPRMPRTNTRSALAARGQGHRRLRRAARRDRAPARRRPPRAKAARLWRLRATLLDEVTALVEQPSVYAGTFDAGYLAVPQECLILTMRQNQKYFPLFDAARTAAAEVPDRVATCASPIRATSSRATSAWCGRGWRTRASSTTRTARRRLEARVPRARERRLPQQARQPARAGRSGSSCCRRDRPRPERRPGARRARGMAGQSRPAHRHGGRVSRAAGHHGPLLRAARRRAARGGRRDRGALPAALRGRPAARSITASCAVALADKLDTLARPLRHRPGRRPATRTRSACAAPRSASSASWSSERLRSMLCAARTTCADAAALDELHLRAAARLSAGAGLFRERGRGGARRSARNASIWCRGSSRRCARSRAARSRKPGRREQAHRQHPQAGRDGARGLRRGTCSGVPKRNALGGRLQAPAGAGRARLTASCEYTSALKALAALKAPVDAFFDKVMVMDEDARVRDNRLGSSAARCTATMNRVADFPSSRNEARHPRSRRHDQLRQRRLHQSPDEWHPIAG